MTSPKPPSNPDGPAGRQASIESLFERLGSEDSPEALARTFLTLQCYLVAGVRQGLLVLGPAAKGPFAAAAVWPEGVTPGRELLQGAERAITERKDMIAVRPPSALGEAAALKGSVVAQPLEFSGRLCGALVLEVSPRREQELRELLLRMRWGHGWLDSMLRRYGDLGDTSGRQRVEQVLSLLAAATDQQGFVGGATALATELATELGCDRVSLGFVQRGRIRVRALSHSAQIGGKTNIIRAIETAMNEAFDQQTTIVYPERPDPLAPGTHAHADLARNHGAGAVCSVPLVYDGKPCGVLTVERDAARPFDPATVKLCEALASLAGPVLEVNRREDRWLAAKIWDAARALAEHLTGPRHVGLKLIGATIAAVIVLLCLVKVDYRITAHTVLEPALLRAAVAPFNGYIARGDVRPGDLVKQGDLLGSLDERDLQLERVKSQSEVEQLTRQYRQALALRDASRSEIFAASLQEAEAELSRVEDHLARTSLRAAFDGVVVAGDLTQQLGAPVERGDVLFEVAPLDDYRVVLKVDERDIADVHLQQRGSLVFSSLPDERFPFEVIKITPVATAEEGSNYFRVEAALDQPDDRLRPAIEGVAKIEVEPRRLIWIWTHDAIDWVRLKLWRWLP